MNWLEHNNGFSLSSNCTSFLAHPNVGEISSPLTMSYSSTHSTITNNLRHATDNVSVGISHCSLVSSKLLEDTSVDLFSIAAHKNKALTHLRRLDYIGTPMSFKLYEHSAKGSKKLWFYAVVFLCLWVLLAIIILSKFIEFDRAFNNFSFERPLANSWDKELSSHQYMQEQFEELWNARNTARRFTE